MMRETGGQITDPSRGQMIRSIALLLYAQVAVLSLWFSAAAVLPALANEHGLQAGDFAGLSAATQIGFVIGALLLAISGMPDRVRPQRLFASFSLLAALANMALLLVHPESFLALMSRLLVGFSLAGVYPVGLKIAVGWSVKRRGLIASLLVGALTLGSASPHFAAYLGGVDWRLTLIGTSAAALTGAFVIFFCRLGPYHQRAAKFDMKATAIAWHDKSIRYAFLGYFGHMWELYAYWAWVGVAASAAAVNAGVVAAQTFGSLVAFLAIALGAIACVPAGLLADRVGKAKVAQMAMLISAASGVLAAYFFDGGLYVFTGVLIVWGISIIPDSAQFSALVADHAPPERVGSLMTLQTALGFALTSITVQFLPDVVAIAGWPAAFLCLTAGPLLGVLVMRHFNVKQP